MPNKAEMLANPVFFWGPGTIPKARPKQGGIMNARILLVDDDQLLREVIGDFLRSRGHEVDIAATKKEAVDFLRQKRYDLALIDHGGRQRSGIKLMREFRQADPNVFCLIMTGFSAQKAVEAAMQQGVSDYILKPFQLEELLNLLQKYL